MTHSSSTTLLDLTKTKTTPPHLTPNTIYKISRLDCPSTYDGQTYQLSTPHRPDERTRTMLQTKESLRRYSVTLDWNKSAPAHHSLTTGHRIARNNINLLKSLPQRSHLNLTEHAAIHVRNPAMMMNRTDSAPKCSSLCIWDPILTKIAKSLDPTPSDHKAVFMRHFSHNKDMCLLIKSLDGLFDELYFHSIL